MIAKILQTINNGAAKISRRESEEKRKRCQNENGVRNRFRSENEKRCQEPFPDS